LSERDDEQLLHSELSEAERVQVDFVLDSADSYIEMAIGELIESLDCLGFIEGVSRPKKSAGCEVNSGDGNGYGAGKGKARESEMGV
jgi:hypothetical protein